MNEIRFAASRPESARRSQLSRILTLGLACAALPAALAAGTDSEALHRVAAGPLVTIEAESALGRARLELTPADYLIEGDRLTWAAEERLALRDPGSGVEIAYLERISLFYLADPVVGIGFTVGAGGAPTNFSLTTASLAFDPIDSPTARASVAFGLTDTNGDGAASLTGTNVDGQAFQGFYNDVDGAPATGATFATLVSSLGTAQSYTSQTTVEELPAGPGFSSTSESGAPLPAISSLSIQCQFLLSAGDAANATTVLVVPEPVGAEWISMVASGAGGSARLDLPLVERRGEDGTVIWSSPAGGVLRDAGSGRELARVEAGTRVAVADHEITVAFTVTSGDSPINILFSTGSLALPALPNTFARSSFALTLTDLDGAGASLFGTNPDGEVYAAFYNDVGGVPGTGTHFATLAAGLVSPTPFSSVAGAFEFDSGGAFSQVDESGALLGTVSSASVQVEFQIGAQDSASGTTVFALHPGGGLTGRVYLDANGSGAQDPGEPGLAGVDVEITDSQAGVQTVTTDGNGDYQAAVPAGSTTVDVDESTLPAGAVQTEGSDPTVVAVPAGGTVSDVDGYQVQGLVSVRVFLDANANGAEDPGEPGLAGVDITVTDSAAGVQTLTTDGNGDASAIVPAGATTLDVDDATLPPDLVLSVGSDPAVVAVPGGGEESARFGYRAFSLVEIPTLGGLGLSLLALGLGLAGARRLARRRPRRG